MKPQFTDYLLNPYKRREKMRLLRWLFYGIINKYLPLSLREWLFWEFGILIIPGRTQIIKTHIKGGFSKKEAIRICEKYYFQTRLDPNCSLNYLRFGLRTPKEFRKAIGIWTV